MLKKYYTWILVLAGCSVFLGSAAWAGCMKSDLVGSWRVYASSKCVDCIPGTPYFTIIIKTDLSVKSGTTGKDPDGDAFRVTGGRFKISKSCAVAGTVNIKDMESGRSYTLTLNGALDRGKTILAGNFQLNDKGRDHGLFTAVKK